MVEQLMRGLVLNDVPVVKEDSPAAHLAGEAHLVRDNDHSHPAFGKLLHNVEHFTDHFGVKRACRLVKQHNVRLHTNSITLRV